MGGGANRPELAPDFFFSPPHLSNPESLQDAEQRNNEGHICSGNIHFSQCSAIRELDQGAVRLGGSRDTLFQPQTFPQRGLTGKGWEG